MDTNNSKSNNSSPIGEAGKGLSRRSFLKILGGGALTTAAVMTGCKSKTESKAVED